MKHFASSLLGLLFGIALLTACTSRPSETRNLSKYAENDFPTGCVYRCDHPHAVTGPQPVGVGIRAKNIILMIGDGMGFEQVGAACVANRGALHMLTLPVTGVARTYSADRLVTDSGAAGTAIACGEKTRNYTIGVDSTGKELPSLLVKARESGRRTGVAVVCRLNDATPAAFCCHAIGRDDAEAIAADYLDGTADYIAGGGLKYWIGRRDGRDLLAEMNRKGYRTCMRPEELESLDQLPAVAVLDTLELPTAPSRGDLFRRMVGKGLELLDNEEGFFLMIEGSCIDDWCHANRIDRAIEEILDFDRTVGDVLRWAERDGETLVIVTADHSTGGLTLLDGDLKEGLVKVNFSSTGHNGIFVPVFAYGPSAEAFAGTYENSELSRRLERIVKR